ncbi:MAG: hemerythrin domain-containing protein [Acidimicrobiales bacterium]
MTIFEALREDHERQRRLIGELLDTTGASEAREASFEELKDELSAHAVHEERQFYVPLMGDDLTQEMARHSVAEHKELEDFIEQLDGYDMSAPQFLVTARELEHRLLHHLREEEQEVFQLAGKALDDIEKQALATAYRAGMAEARAD